MKMLGEYLPSDWRSLETMIRDENVLWDTVQALLLTLDHATPDGGAISDEIDSIAYRLKVIGFWKRLTPLSLFLIFQNRPADLVAIFQKHIDRRFM